jgi:hypothetical protein
MPFTGFRRRRVFWGFLVSFDHPLKFIYRGTDETDDMATFYAPLMEECPYLPEFQSIFTEGTAGQYFKYALKFGMKNIIRFHGHSCEALYYKDCKIGWEYDRPELLQRLRDIKDNLKYLPEGQKPTITPKKIREEFTWLQYRHLREVFKHPLEERFQIKRVPGYKWEYPHCEPLRIPRLDQKAKSAAFPPHPEKLE